MILTYINLWLFGDVVRNDKEHFSIKSIVVVDCNGTEHVLTWDECVMNTKNVLIGGTQYNDMLDVRLLNVSVDGEPLAGRLYQIAPFLVKHVNYSYTGDMEDELWFTFFKVDIIDAFEHYSIEGSDAVYCSSWDTSDECLKKENI